MVVTTAFTTTPLVRLSHGLIRTSQLSVEPAACDSHPAAARHPRHHLALRRPRSHRQPLPLRAPARRAPAASASSTPSPSSAPRPSRLAVLASGGGRSLANLLAKVASGELARCDIALVVASKPSAGALAHAAHHGVASAVVRRPDFADDAAFSAAVAAQLDAHQIDLVVMAGWMHFFHIPDRYLGRVVNIHPSLIPAFSGKGYYGSRVHDAVVKAGVKVTGCTVHLADNIYDHGPIILQRTVSVQAEDTADDVAARVFEQELQALPDAVQLFVDGRLELRENIVHITSSAPSSSSLSPTPASQQQNAVP